MYNWVSVGRGGPNLKNWTSNGVKIGDPAANNSKQRSFVLRRPQAKNPAILRPIVTGNKEQKMAPGMLIGQSGFRLVSWIYRISYQVSDRKNSF